MSLKRQKAHTMSSSQTVQIRPVPCICQPSHYQQWYQQNEGVDQLVLFLAFPEARWMHKIRCRTVNKIILVSNHNCIQWVEVRPNPIKEKFNGTKCQSAIEFLHLCLNFGVKPTFAQAEHGNVANGRSSQKITKKIKLNKKGTKQTKYLIRKYLQLFPFAWGAMNLHLGAARQ